MSRARPQTDGDSGRLGCQGNGLNKVLTITLLLVIIYCKWPHICLIARIIHMLNEYHKLLLPLLPENYRDKTIYYNWE